jgi:hypothetical protein
MSETQRLGLNLQDEKNENSNLSNGREILQHIKDMKSRFAATPVDVVEEAEMTFLDKLNRLSQLILNDDSFAIYQALDKESMEKWKKKRFSRWLKRTIATNYKNTFYFMFLASITAFLVSEAVTFYADGQVADAHTYVKAILTEVSFIFLSGYVSKDWKQKIWVNTLRAGVFSLMLFVISSQTILSGTKVSTNSTAIQEQVQLLETQIADKEKTIQFYRDKGWGNSVRKQTEDKNKLVDKLIALKEQQAQGSNEKVSNQVVYRSYGQAFFRVLLLLISVLITRRLYSF